MVVLEENHVEESDAVVGSSADFHRLLFEHTHAGGSLACIKHAGFGAGIDKRLLVAVRHGGNSAHALHDVEHQTFGLEQALYLAADDECHIAGFHVCAVFDEDFHLQCGVELAEYLAGYAYAGKDAFFLDEQAALSHGVFGDATQGGVVAVADVFRKCKFDELLVELVYGIHNVMCYVV